MFNVRGKEIQNTELGYKLAHMRVSVQKFSVPEGPSSNHKEDLEPHGHHLKNSKATFCSVIIRQKGQQALDLCIS